MQFSVGLRRFRGALAHWGVGEYFLIGVVWLTLSIPLYVSGWGIASVLSLPLLLLIGAVVTYALASLLNPGPQLKAQPRPGFPESLESASLGTFPLSAYSDSRYEGPIDWCGAQVQLSLSVESAESVGEVLLAAASLTAACSEVNAAVTQFVVKELLPSINQDRQSEGSAVLTPEEFVGAISLQMITLHSDETYEFLYDDGNLLGGHWIEAHGSLTEGPIEVDTPG